MGDYGTRRRDPRDPTRDAIRIEGTAINTLWNLPSQINSVSLDVVEWKGQQWLQMHDGPLNTAIKALVRLNECGVRSVGPKMPRREQRATAARGGGLCTSENHLDLLTPDRKQDGVRDMRDEALRMVREFAPKMGRRYAAGRNYDRGPGRHTAVSQLSPYIRRRLVTEAEVVAAALEQHGPEGAEKFIQEVVWRGYFKGWLERRPSIWADYRRGLRDDLAMLEIDRRLRKQVAAAEAGATGIACFDAWVAELVETGYLHNHARMWFASIWIFTLELPWRVGSDFFYRYLLDGDPASNTLGWRWVAGLHTRGKAYQAQAWNIDKFTNGRFTPRPAELADGVMPLDGTEPEGLPPVSPLRAAHAPNVGVPTALLITEEDCCLEDFDPMALQPRAVATLASSHLRSDRPVAAHVRRFEADALADAARRLAVDAERLEARDPSDLAKWAVRAGAQQIATGFVPRGPLRDWLDEAAPALDSAGIELREWRRDWDTAIWPHATAGFFKVKKTIPRLIESLDLVA